MQEEEPTQKEEVKKEQPQEQIWKPKSKLGKMVVAGEITSIEEVFEKGLKIKESKIVDILMPDLQTDLLLIGQAKGKFGGGQRRVFRQTQKKTKEGNKPKFSTLAIVGNKDGFIGIGFGKAKETVPAREKALRNAKIGIFKVARGCGSWQCGCRTPHSIPFKVEGKCGSVKIKLMPAPKGKGIICEKEVAKVLQMAGIKDVWAKSYGQQRIKLNLIRATLQALHKTVSAKKTQQQIDNLGIIEGRVKPKPVIENIAEENQDE